MNKITIHVSLLIASLACGHAIACEQLQVSDSDFPDSLSKNSGSANGIAAAWYDGATDRYGHGVLGDAIEPSVLNVSDQSGCGFTVELDTDHVFEDIETRLADIDKKPGVEVITIRSHQNKGAQLAIYALSKEKGLHLLASTPYIGTSNRWLAPIGIADFDNNGSVDIAFVDRPHLAKVLRVWSYADGKLTQTASNPGYSNHRIGEDYISGGVRRCDGKASMITADAYWDRVIETTLVNGKLVSRDLAPFENRDSLTRALQCE